MNHVERARAMIGTRFRPQGRSVELGVDCLGLVAIAYRLPLDHIPTGYRLRGDHGRTLIAGLRTFFRPVRKVACGDLLLLVAGHEQMHLAVTTDIGFVHADARHGVIETPGDPPWPLLQSFRRRAR
jgi:hypothetical protein